MRRIMVAIMLSAASLYPFAGRAEQSATFGDYTVHYNALTTNLLDPAVASTYDITRSKHQALLNVTVLKKVMGTTGQPVRARVTASAINLSAQLRELQLRELDDGGAIYYIGQFPVNDEEVLKFEVTVQPEGQTEKYTTRFEQQFFID